MTESYWGTIGDIDRVITPVDILKEQAEKLGEPPQHALHATVTTGEGTFPYKLCTTLSVRAYGLGDYSMDIVSIYYQLNLYPLTLSNDLKRDARDVECVDEDEFRRELRSILSSEQTSTTLKHLCALARSA